MYTGREELRACKRRNQREYVYKDCDWRRAVEEDEMRADNRGRWWEVTMGSDDGGQQCRNIFRELYLTVGQGSLRPFAKISGAAVTLQLSLL